MCLLILPLRFLTSTGSRTTGSLAVSVYINIAYLLCLILSYITPLHFPELTVRRTVDRNKFTITTCYRNIAATTQNCSHLDRLTARSLSRFSRTYKLLQHSFTSSLLLHLSPTSPLHFYDFITAFIPALIPAWSSFNNMDDDMIGTQVPPLETSPVDGDTRIDDGVEGLRANEVDSDGEMRDNEYGGEDGGDLDKALFGNENEDGEEQNLTGEFLLDQEDVVPGLDGPYDYADSTDDVVQPDDSSQGTIRETVENDHGTEFQHDQSRVDSTMSSQDEELREEGSGQIDEAQPGQHNSEQEQEQERIDIGSGQAQRGFTPRCPSIKDNHYEDSSALFVSQSPSPPPQTQPPPHFTRLPAPATRTPPSARVSTPSRQPAATSQLSTFAKIRNMQKRLQEKKNTASRNATASASNINPDNETYLEAVTSGITPSAAATKGVSPVDDDDMENRLAIAEFQKQKRHYDELKRKARDGKLTFRMDVEWMKIKGAEEARKKKRARDIAKAREEEGGEQDLFLDINNVADEVPEEELDGSSELYGTDSRKRRRGREHPRKTGKSRSMADAERHSMQVALDAGEDRPKKKKKKDEAAEGSSAGGNGPAKRSRGSKTNVSKGPSRSKAASKAPAKGGRGTAKKKLEVANAIKQATSLFNSNVFMQQAGANAREQPVFRSRVKADALKELIASVPIEDVKKVRGDINILMAATKDFDGRGSVKSDGFGLWRPKGMRTSLKGYQILGTAFMRRRENSAEEPKGGLMADQMGLGKTLMMLGKCRLLPISWCWYEWNITNMTSKHRQRTATKRNEGTPDDPDHCWPLASKSMEE